MDKKAVLTALKKARETSKKRNFKQTFDLIVNLKSYDLKKTDSLVDFYVSLHYSKGKKTKVCALVGPELKEQAEEACEFMIPSSEFDSYSQDKKKTKKLADSYDYFVAQATVMPKLATAFGRVFGPRGKMPNPKAGCVVPPNANLKALHQRLQKLLRVSAKIESIVQCPVGSEDMPDAEIIDNVHNVYDHLLQHLALGKNNVRSAYIKLTMGPSVSLFGDKVEEEETPVNVKKEKPAEEKEEPEEKKEEVKTEEKPEETKEVKKTKTKEKKNFSEPQNREKQSFSGPRNRSISAESEISVKKK